MIAIMLELKKNILKFGYGINYKYEGMLSHSFDRFYILTKFELPKLEDLKLTMISYDSICQYLEKAKSKKSYSTQYITDMCNGVDISANDLNKYINLHCFVLSNIIMLCGAKMILIPFKPLQNFKFLLVTIWPGCTELTPTNQMQPLIS